MTDDAHASALVSIGELARRTGLAVRTIRFYCDEGIVESRRSPGGHRMFDAATATERLLLIRRLRALGLGLDSITEVLRGERSIAEAIAAESARLDIEFRSLTWRRAALRAVETASPSQRDERLAVLAAAQDGGAVHDCLVGFWRRVLAPIPRRDVDIYVHWNVPEPPADPSVDEVVAYAELAALVADPEMTAVVRQQLWRGRPESIRDRPGLYAAVDNALTDVVPLVSKGVRPRGGGELDRFVTAHARARGERDSARFRKHLLADATDTDHRIHRYWALTAQFLGTRVTVGRAHHWLYDALTQSIRVTDRRSG
ncbi:MerR family transcriptional regulator [Nocardia sp. CDC159]|uniref:MerR family transcriptional regulator n=1 Tax=Nocardia pulmonis TaxID=2951408 RepID=A0A9X2EHG9_9NOCA|nr:MULTISPECIES: MerR family transcriptional regulator [Nocardia]MCM6778743.1 MerR family transcriptional regulator [Nocardia pulmonis]MCM6791632.1 MerR family transcriptional regulator [Nocardia sp. CDC159]